MFDSAPVTEIRSECPAFIRNQVRLSGGIRERHGRGTRVHHATTSNNYN